MSCRMRDSPSCQAHKPSPRLAKGQPSLDCVLIVAICRRVFRSHATISIGDEEINDSLRRSQWETRTFSKLPWRRINSSLGPSLQRLVVLDCERARSSEPSEVKLIH